MFQNGFRQWIGIWMIFPNMYVYLNQIQGIVKWYTFKNKINDLIISIKYHTIFDTWKILPLQNQLTYVQFFCSSWTCCSFVGCCCSLNPFSYSVSVVYAYWSVDVVLFSEQKRPVWCRCRFSVNEEELANETWNPLLPPQ